MAAFDNTLIFRASGELRTLLEQVAARRGESLSTVLRRAVANGVRFEQ